MVGEKADLAAVVSFVGEHVGKHLEACGPGWGEGVAAEGRDAALGLVEGLSEHGDAGGCACAQGFAGLFWSAMRPVELRGEVEEGCVEADPLAADVVDVAEDGGDRADFAWWLEAPRGGVEMFDDGLVEAIVEGEELRGGVAERRVGGVGRGHG